MNGVGAGARGTVCSFGEHDRILSRRDLNDTLKTRKIISKILIKTFFHFLT